MKLSLILEQYLAQKSHIGSESSDEDAVVKHILNCTTHVKKLKHFVYNIKFQNEKEEIYFYKVVNPSIVGDFIYFNRVLKYYEHLPFASKKEHKKYIRNTLLDIKAHRSEVGNLYRYFLNGLSKYDNIYFVRNQQLDLFQSDPVSTFEPDFFTYHSYKFCQIKANLKLIDFLHRKKKEIKKKKLRDNGPRINSNLSWTATKTDLIELIYSLKTAGAINGGNATIKDMVDLFTDIFQVEIPNHYKVYSEIKNRTGERSKFTEKLTQSFNNKLDQEDAW